VVKENVPVPIVEDVVLDSEVVTFVTRVGVVHLEHGLTVNTRPCCSSKIVNDVVLKVDGLDNGTLRCFNL